LHACARQRRACLCVHSCTHKPQRGVGAPRPPRDGGPSLACAGWGVAPEGGRPPRRGLPALAAAKRRQGGGRRGDAGQCCPLRGSTWAPSSAQGARRLRAGGRSGPPWGRALGGRGAPPNGGPRLRRGPRDWGGQARSRRQGAAWSPEGVRSVGAASLACAASKGSAPPRPCRGRPPKREAPPSGGARRSAWDPSLPRGAPGGPPSATGRGGASMSQTSPSPWAPAKRAPSAGSPPAPGAGGRVLATAPASRAPTQQLPEWSPAKRAPCPPLPKSGGARLRTDAVSRPEAPPRPPPGGRDQ
jgi:hypothetical protein